MVFMPSPGIMFSGCLFAVFVHSSRQILFPIPYSCNNFYAHGEQGVNPGQVRWFDGILYKLWLLLWPLLHALISSVKVSAALTREPKQTDVAKSPG